MSEHVPPEGWEAPDDYLLIDGADGLLSPPPLVREAEEERRLLKRLLRLSREARSRLLHEIRELDE